MANELVEALAARERKGLTRRLRRMDEIRDNGTLLLSTNNYLGLAEDPEMKAGAANAIHQFGTGSTGSRLTTGNLMIHEMLEQQLASFKSPPSSLVPATWPTLGRSLP